LPIRNGICHFRRPVLPLIRLDRPGHLSLKHSMPKWLVERWLDRFGDEEVKLLLASCNEPPRTSARVTHLAPSRDAVIESLAAESIEAEPDGSRDDVIALRRTGDLRVSETLKRGWLQVQDPTSVAIGAMLSPAAGARVLDLCAAPGGKAMQLLERVGSSGHVVATDRSAEKIEILHANLARSELPFSTVEVSSDPAVIDLRESFSHVLVDAPCSNTGVLSRRADVRWRLRERDFESLATLQAGLLEAAYRHLAPGGRLLYGTCSIEPSENEERIAAFVSAHPEMQELETRLFLPHRSAGDGGFASLLLRPRAAAVEPEPDADAAPSAETPQ
jgi:16S rRNA (cytosine967-C5)-methyltransferase